MKTLLQALADELHYPVPAGHLENRLLKRGLDAEAECTADVLNSNAFKGALADSLVLLIAAPGFSEADKSFTLSDKDSILELANSIYTSIGEDENVVEDETPTVYIGRAAWQ